jgi:hypothetical protein
MAFTGKGNGVKGGKGGKGAKGSKGGKGGNGIATNGLFSPAPMRLRPETEQEKTEECKRKFKEVMKYDEEELVSEFIMTPGESLQQIGSSAAATTYFELMKAVWPKFEHDTYSGLFGNCKKTPANAEIAIAMDAMMVQSRAQTVCVYHLHEQNL